MVFNKKVFIPILVFSIISLAVVKAQNEPMYIDGISASVGDQIILKSDLAQLVSMTAIQRGLDPKTNYNEIAKLQEDILFSLIDQKVMLEMAALDSIEVKEKEVTQALEMQVDNIVMQAGSEERAQEMLGQTLRSFKRDYWADMRDKLITDRYQQTLMSGVSITRSELEDFYKRFKDSMPVFPASVKMNHILFTIEPGEENTTRTINFLDSLKIEIENGYPFEEAAKQFSQDPGSKNNGGNLGFVRRGSLVPSFEKVAFTLTPGEISAPVKSVFGYHLIQTLESRGDKISVRHILIIPEITMNDESRTFASAQIIADSIASIDQFRDFASRYSTDEKTKGVGGSLGWIEPGSYPVKEISEVIPYLTKNTCSPPVKSDYGYHLLWLEDIRKGGKPTLSTHWLEIEEMALNYKKMQWYQEWIDEARKKFHIKIYN